MHMISYSIRYCSITISWCLGILYHGSVDFTGALSAQYPAVFSNSVVSKSDGARLCLDWSRVLEIQQPNLSQPFFVFFWTIFKNNPCIWGEYGAWYFVATKLITDEGIKAARKISEVKSKEGIHNAVIDVIKVGVSNMHVQATGSEKTTALVHFVSYSKLHTISHTLCIRHGMYHAHDIV